MKKFFVLLVAAAAALILTASISASDNTPSQGTVSFESSSFPALNCTMSIQRVENIYSLLPDNVRDICEREYKEVRTKCNSSSRFTHEGVSVRVMNDGTTITVELSVKGYTVTANNVTMEELDRLFGDQ